MNQYPEDYISPEDDDGTMPANVAELAEQVVGHRIVSAEKGIWSGRWYGNQHGLILTLDTGKRVRLANTDDCCAYTELERFLFNPDRIEHVITGVATEDGYSKWHIYADLGDVLQLDVAWSPGNPFYYGYGFNISVEEETK